MLKYLSPGELLSDAVGLGDDDHRVIFRMFINTMVWGAIGAGVMLWLLV
ncbi:MAG: hypothetical protein ACR2PI_26965 [Hyphomicrobiaceae bacterium]